MLLWLWVLGCQEVRPPDEVRPEILIEGSSWRMSRPVPTSDGPMKLRVFERPDDCADAARLGPLAARRCPPFVDAERAELRIGLEVVRDGAVPVALTEHDVAVRVPGGGRGVVALKPGKDFELVPYQPLDYRQLWVLLVDRSDSMYKAAPGDRPVMEKVVGALLSDATKDAFFPEQGSHTTGVLLLSFTNGVHAVPEGPWTDARVIVDREQYAFYVDKLLDRPLNAGYTHLYEAVQVTLDQVMVTAEVRGFPGNDSSDPAVIVLTDGYNNERPEDTCGTNAARLSRLLTALQAIPQQVGRQGTILHTVGFGKPFSAFEPTNVPPFVTPQMLCGLEADRVINNGLELTTIDNVSLSYLALVGGGRSYVGDDPNGLARFLGTTGALVHEWYGLHIRLPDDLRKRMRMPLPVVVSTSRPRRLETRFTLFPHPWFDAAPGQVPFGARWAEARPMWAASAWLLIWLGATLGVFGFGIGWHHAWRALARRAREGGDGR